MKLYGTKGSPFARRAHVVALEVGERVERIDTATEAGQAALRAVTPIGKVPVAELDGKTLFDSRVIIEWLVTTRSWAGLAPPRDRWLDHNLVNAADAALDSIANLFLLKRDGVAIEGTMFHQRQLDRVSAIYEWLGPQLRTAELGLPELTVICSLDWMDFRQTYPTERAGLEKFRAAWRERPSLIATRPEVLAAS